MVAIIVAAHGETAPALLKTSGMILGEIEGVTPVTFLPGQGPEDLLEAYAAAVGPEEDVLLLVDLFGGSPYNAGARFVAEREHADVVTGVNVPMLLEVLPAAKRPTATVEKLVAKAVKAGSRGVRSFKETMAPAQKTPTQQAPAAGSAPAAGAEQTSPDGQASTDAAARSALTPPGATAAPAAAGQAPQAAPAGAVVPLEEIPRDPERHMDVAFLRIDSRLIHGQVANNWVNDIAPRTLIAASDAAAEDTLRKTLLLQVGPASVRTNVLTVERTVRVYWNPDYAGMRTMIVVESPMDALRLLREGVRVKEVNVGGVTYRKGMTQVSEAVSVDDKHVAAYRAIHDLGIPLILQQVPSSSRQDMMATLKEKGMLR
ncbi:EIIAB-Man [Rothia kristinae]|uniref:mannose/fructose/sorbose PTS transporter subunit IIA n=1 Tax=Rothia kristinae TaxID=37923 RepID=UPI0007744BB5|nr:mannose/fructose/sorbose PTS transporter subunit IIA [Rothia kristinae]SQC36972.1 EIIAB-Man [Rothia kristinae]